MTYDDYGAARQLAMDAQFERDNDIRAMIRDIEGDVCTDCAGVITIDTTPGYVYKEKDICDCEPA